MKAPTVLQSRPTVEARPLLQLKPAPQDETSVPCRRIQGDLNGLTGYKSWAVGLPVLYQRGHSDMLIFIVKVRHFLVFRRVIRVLCFAGVVISKKRQSV